jgi:hypothetical protein
LKDSMQYLESLLDKVPRRSDELSGSRSPHEQQR